MKKDRLLSFIDWSILALVIFVTVAAVGARVRAGRGLLPIEFNRTETVTE